MSNVRSYNDKELLDKVKSLLSYDKKKGIPKQLVVAVRSNEDESNIFDDKVYVFIDGVFKLVSSITTNPGKSILQKGWKAYNTKGAAILKSDEVYYDCYLRSDGSAKAPHHNGKMECLRQVKPMKYYRDGDNDDKSEEYGDIEVKNNATNLHFSNYNLWTKVKTMFINGWSAGCQVMNVPDDYRELLSCFNYNEPITYALLKEF